MQRARRGTPPGLCVRAGQPTCLPPAEDVFLLTSRDRRTPLLYAVFSTSR